MSGTLIAYIPPKASPWSFFGPSDMTEPYPKILNSEGLHTLGWNLLFVENVLMVEFVLNKHDSEARPQTIKSFMLPAEPTFSLLNRAFEVTTKRPITPDMSLGDIFESSQADLDSINDEMKVQHLYLKELLSDWIEPGDELDRLAVDLYTCISGDVIMALSEIRPSWDIGFPGK